MALIGLILASFFKMFLYFHHKRKMAEFNKKVTQHLGILGKQLQSQTTDLREAMDMIDNEYSRIMKTSALENYRAKQRKPAQTDVTGSEKNEGVKPNSSPPST